MCDFIPTSKIYIFHYPCALQAKCLGNFLCFLKINRLTQKYTSILCMVLNNGENIQTYTIFETLFSTIFVTYINSVWVVGTRVSDLSGVV